MNDKQTIEDRANEPFKRKAEFCNSNINTIHNTQYLILTQRSFGRETDLGGGDLVIYSIWYIDRKPVDCGVTFNSGE